MHPMRTPWKTELGFSDAAAALSGDLPPRTSPDTMAPAARAAVLPRNARLVVASSVIIRVFIAGLLIPEISFEVGDKDVQ
jgi:hypothetical protein